MVTDTLTPVWTAGNLTSDGDRSYGYDPFNRLTSISGGNGSDVDLDYDPLGRLAEVDVAGGVMTRFQYDGATMIAETDGAGAVMRRGTCPGLDPGCMGDCLSMRVLASMTLRASRGHGCAAGAL